MTDLAALLKEARTWLHHGEDNCLNDNAKWEHANLLNRIDAALATQEAEPERKCGTCNRWRLDFENVGECAHYGEGFATEAEMSCPHWQRREGT